ncbi:MAG: ferritin-like domain-containing protein [Cyclonatronaceae bacterium]
MEKEKTFDALNKLVEINNDRIEGYEKASENTEERDLQELFSMFKQTSRKCQRELISEISKLGKKPTVGTTTSGKFFRTWMDVKSALTGKDRKAVLNSCEYGEENADKTYQSVLDDESEYLNHEQQSMIREQQKMLKADQGKIKSMLNKLEEAPEY